MNKPDDAPDFSFLGGDEASDAPPGAFDFSVDERAESQVEPDEPVAEVSAPATASDLADSDQSDQADQADPEVPAEPDVPGPGSVPMPAEVESPDDTAAFDFANLEPPPAEEPPPVDNSGMDAADIDTPTPPPAAHPRKSSIRRLKPKVQPAVSTSVDENVVSAAAGMSDVSKPAATEVFTGASNPTSEREAATSATTPASTATDSVESAESDSVTPTIAAVAAADMVPKKLFTMVAGYAAALTLVLLVLLFTGQLRLGGSSSLESLPDVAPLRSNEFQEVPVSAALPDGHQLTIGQSERFGDVLLTPTKVTREPLRFASMMTGREDSNLQTRPLLKLWFRVQNMSDDMAFPPWDVSLMSHRFPLEGADETTRANSWLMARYEGSEKRILNYLHPATSNFDLVGQHSRQMLKPGEELTTFVVCSEEIAHFTGVESYRWRLQIRKGVHRSSGNGVTTLVDIRFTESDIEA